MNADTRESMQLGFRAEGAELLTEFDAALLALETDPTNAEFVHRVFRAIHTLKGSGATAGCGHLSALAHTIEELFVLARSGRLRITPELVDCGLKACDVMSAILNSEDPDAESPGELAIVDSIATLRLRQALQGVPEHPSPPPPSGPSAERLSEFLSPGTLEIFLTECQEHLDTFEEHALRLADNKSSSEGFDAFFRAVHTIKGSVGLLLAEVPAGSIAPGHPLWSLAAVAHSVESLLDLRRADPVSSIDAETATLLLEARDSMQTLLGSISAMTGSSSAPIENPEAPEPLTLPSVILMSKPEALAFQNVAAQCLTLCEHCLRQIEGGQPSRSILKTYQRGLKTLQSAAVRRQQTSLGEPVAKQVALVEAALLSGDALSSEELKQIRQYLEEVRSIVANFPSDRPSIAGEAANPAKLMLTGTRTPTTIRIDQAKLDRLMRVVGELLVAKDAIPTLAAKLAAGEDLATVTKSLRDAGKSISHIADELQSSVMTIRMLPIKTVFQRFPRLVHDMARNLGKEVQLVIEGETTELDKTILEQIGDPLIHMVRNALDHGLENPEERARKGKASSGRLTLRASNEAGSVIIEVEDDGRGLDIDALKKKALERGLLTHEAALTMPAAEAHRLVFLPGLSTAEQVTDVSGRGVGMDVVQTNIQTLQGAVDIRSNIGRGTVFSIKLPTSLMICKGILLEAGHQEYIVPLTSIRDMVKISASEVHDFESFRITQVRGEVYPVFSLAEMFGLPASPAAELPIAIIECGRVRYGLIAERFVSQVEVLVKPLAGGLERHKAFHGAAIMSDGRVVLVLNPLECLRLKTAAAA